MKLVRENRSVIQSSYDMESVSFGIRSADSPIIMEMLRSKIYSNKPAAVVREYTTNALDEHKLHNITKDVQITAPTQKSPELKIRDYGKGLTKPEIIEIYVNYGCSTKRGSDDLTGGLGIGCKAGFAYGSQFTITSWTEEDGKIYKRVYVAIIDESHTGTLKVVSEELDSTNHTGIEIGIGVKVEDINAFQKEIWNLWLTCSVKPVIDGMSKDSFKNIECLVDQANHPKTPYKRYKNSQSYYENNKYRSSIAVMGNIGYPIDTALLRCSTGIKNMLRDKGIHIHFDIGELSIASNREELEYNDVTIKNIEAKAELVLDDILGAIKEKVMESECLFDRQIAWANHTENMENNMISLLKDRVDHNIHSLHFKIPQTHKSIHYEFKYHGGERKLFATDVPYVRWGASRWKSGKFWLLFADPLTAQANITRRVKTFVKVMEVGYNDELCVIYKSTITDKLTDVMKGMGWPSVNEDKLHNIMDYEPMKANSTLNGPSKTTQHVDLFKYQTDRVYTETEAWVDAGNVSIGSTNSIFYLHLCGVTAIRPEGSTIKNANSDSRLQLMRGEVNNLIAMAETYGGNMTASERSALQGYIDDNNKLAVGRNALYPLYAVRKRCYKKLESLPNAVNLHTFVQTLVSREIERQHAKGPLLSDSIVLTLDQEKKFGDKDDRDRPTWNSSRNYSYTYRYNQTRSDPTDNLINIQRNTITRKGIKEDLHAYLFREVKFRSKDKCNTFAKLLQISEAETPGHSIESLCTSARFLKLKDKLLAYKEVPGALKPGEMFKVFRKIVTWWPMLNAAITEIIDANDCNDLNNADRIMFGIFRNTEESDDDNTARDTAWCEATLQGILDNIVKYLST